MQRQHKDSVHPPRSALQRASFAHHSRHCSAEAASPHCSERVRVAGGTDLVNVTLKENNSLDDNVSLYILILDSSICYFHPTPPSNPLSAVGMLLHYQRTATSVQTAPGDLRCCPVKALFSHSINPPSWNGGQFPFSFCMHQCLSIEFPQAMFQTMLPYQLGVIISP